jgi:REP element-mobilizing transposase RayT
MSGQRRLFRFNKVYHITNRTGEGLPFVPNKFMELLIGGLLARTQEKYPGIIVNAVVFMGNHYHMIVTINTDPATLSTFMGYFQGELSGIIHRLTGVSNKRLWATKFKASELLTPEAVMRKLNYIYSNPVASNLVESINDWEGFSSWHELNGGDARNYRWISDSLIETRLPKDAFNDKSIATLVESISNIGGGARVFQCDPFFWKRCFKEYRNKSDTELREELLVKIKETEQEFREKRETNGFPIMGAERLRYQCIYKRYKPKKFGTTPTCESTCQETAKQFRSVYSTFKEQCTKVYESWKKGRFELLLPPGAFYPPLKPRASILIAT